MNKVVNINLGGYPFSIDTDAYEYLSRYLKTIHRHFKKSEGYEEITSDIEARMAELFQESMGNQLIVTSDVVEDAISIMGTPEDFGATSIDEKDYSQQTNSSQSTAHNYKTGKRLFRDPEDEVVSGVCSGIAAYFGIEDPLWVRLGFVAFTATGGFGIPVYILLAILVPKAKTSGDRLAMRGDAINVSNIAKLVEEEFSNISDKLSEMTDNWDSKKKNITATDGSFRSTLAKGVSVLGQFIRHILTVLPVVFKPLVFIVGFALMIAFIVIWILSIISFFLGSPLATALVPDQPFVAFLGLANTAILIGVPILSLALLAGRLVFKTKYNVKWSRSLWVLWALNIVCLFGIGSYIAKQFSVNKTVEAHRQDIPVNGETLQVTANENPFKDAWIRVGQLDIAGKELASTNVRIHIHKAENDQFSVVQEYSSRGEDIADAMATASSVRNNFDVAENSLTINPYFVIGKGEKWRAQKAVFNIYVPVGKSIQFANLSRMTRHHLRYIDNGNHQWHHVENGETLIMTEDGFKNPNQKEQSHHHNNSKEHRTYSQYQDFQELSIQGKMKVTIEKGDEYSVEVKGKEQYINSVEIEQDAQRLSIHTNLSNTSSPLRVYIKLPSLIQLDIAKIDDVHIAGFKEDKMRITSKGESRADIKAFMDVKELELDLNSSLELNIRGSGEKLIANLSDRAELDAERFAVKTARLEIQDRGNASLAVSDTLVKKITDRGKVEVDGEPVIIDN